MIDLNNRFTPSFFKVSEIPFSDQAKRITAVAIPFLCLYKPIDRVLTASFTAFYLTKHIMVDLCKNRGKEKCSQRLFHTLIRTATYTLPLFFPLVVQGFTILQQLQQLYDADSKGKRCQIIFEILSSSIHLASNCSIRSHYLFLSLIMRALSEFRESYKEYNQGNYLEAISNTVLGAIRVHSAQKPFFDMKRENFGKVMDQKEWEAFQSSVEGKKEVDVEKYMIDNQYKSSIQNVTVSESIKGYRFKNLRFNQCSFTETALSSDFTEGSTSVCAPKISSFVGSQVSNSSNSVSVSGESSSDNSLRGFDFIRESLMNSKKDGLDLRSANFYNCLFENVAFKGCDLKGASFYGTRSFKLSFSDSDLRGVNFNDSVHTQFMIKNSLLEGTCFLGGRFMDAVIKVSDLTNCLLTTAKEQFRYEGCTEHCFTKPVFAMPWCFSSPQSYLGGIPEAVESQGGITLKFEENPKDINLKKLKDEIKALSLQAEWASPNEQTRAQFMLAHQGEGAECQKLVNKAKIANSYADAVILGGGEDVDQVFYKTDNSDFGVETKRTVMEFALIDESNKENKPLMGTCRGAQVTNVYFGGTLHNVEGQHAVQNLKFESTDHPELDSFKKVFPEGLIGYSVHNQACDKIGEGLTVLATHGDVPKLLANKEGTILLTQFHPEAFTDLKQGMKDPDYKLIKELIKYFTLSKEEAIKLYNFLNSGIVASEKELEGLLKNENIYALFFEKVRAFRNVESAASAA